LVLGHYRGYESLFVVDPGGRVLASTRAEQLDPAQVEILHSVAPGRGRVSPIRRSEFLGRPSLLVVHPVQGSRGGERRIGFFVERPDLRELEAILATVPSDPLPAFWLIDGEGRVVIRRGRVEAEPGVSPFPGERPPPDAESGPVREAVFPGLGEVVYGVRRLKGGGFLAVTVPAAAYRSLYESRNRLLAFGLVGLALVLLVSLVVARDIVQPIPLLSEGARRMSAGDLDVTLPVRGQDELAERRAPSTRCRPECGPATKRWRRWRSPTA
jgi:HAMP domain-containing protein